ncbi:MAG: DUF4860 domain-containing protein [Lachnospiraceae bacterium]|nr:DUF4860 domain-containing protein [Lachnospiraceae bacterium]
MNFGRKRKTDVIFVLFIFCMFIFSVLIVLSLSGTGYKNIINLTQKKADEQIALSFIWTKVKNGDEINKVYLTDFHDFPALCIESEFDGITFFTMIYHYDGWIREMFFEKGYPLSLGDGFPIMKAETYRLEQLEQGLLRISVNNESLLISPRGKKGIL